jgi:hypothetical protein
MPPDGGAFSASRSEFPVSKAAKAEKLAHKVKQQSKRDKRATRAAAQAKLKVPDSKA